MYFRTDKADLIKVVNIRYEIIQQLRLMRKNIDYREFFIIQPGRYPGSNSPMLDGKYYLGKKEIIFKSRNKLASGKAYSVKFNIPYLYALINFPITSNQSILSMQLEPGKNNTDPPRITEVYPTIDQLPSNQIRFHVLFSTSMKNEGIKKHIYLLNPQGQIIEKPLIINDTSLWDVEHRLLTLEVDTEQLIQNLSLQPDEKYTLVIDSLLSDFAGRTLTSTFKKRFSIKEADKTNPDPRKWDIIEPNTENAPLVIQFDEPMDYLMLKRAISILDTYGYPVDGDVHLSENEKKWTFSASTPWPAGIYTIKINNNIEDLAGNRLYNGSLTDNKEETQNSVYPSETVITFSFKTLH